MCTTANDFINDFIQKTVAASASSALALAPPHASPSFISPLPSFFAKVSVVFVNEGKGAASTDGNRTETNVMVATRSENEEMDFIVEVCSDKKM
jgi:hypothetical protein